MERISETEPRRFYVLSADIEAHGQTGGCPGCAALASHGRAIKLHNDECRERVRTIIERTLTGRARMNAYKDRIAETERLKEKKKARETDGGSTDGRIRREEKGAADVLMEPRKDEQMEDRHAVASSEDENRHEENRMSDSHTGKRGAETTNEEQPEKLRRTVRFEQEAPNTSTSSSSTPFVSLEYPASGERQIRADPVLAQSSGHVDDDIQISALDVLCEMDGRESRYIKEVLGWYREEDSGDLKISALSELVGSMTRLNALEEKFLQN